MTSTTEINYKELYEQLKKEHEELKKDYKEHQDEYEWFYIKRETEYLELKEEKEEEEERQKKILREWYEYEMKRRKEQLDFLLSLVKEGDTLHQKYHDENKQMTYEEWYDEN